MSTFTPDQRAKAAEARRAAIEAGAHYRRDYADADHWAELADRRGISLPQWHVAPTPGRLKFWHQTLDGRPFREVYGDRMTLKRLIELNPDWPLRAFVGVMLENGAEKESAANLGGRAAEGSNNCRSRTECTPDDARGTNG